MFKKLLHALGRLFITVFLGVENACKITDEQCIIASNHNSHIDITILFRLFDLSRVDKVKTIAAKGYFDKGLMGRVAKILFNAILVDRSAFGKKSYEILANELKNGYSLIIFPEGTRGEPGVMNEFKSGIGRIAIDFPEIPIYPVYLSGAEKSFPKGAYIPVPFNIKMKVFDPIYGRDYLGSDLKESRKNITAEIENRIRTALEN